MRLTGQDSGRGTFFHRHAVLHDQAHRAGATCRCSTWPTNQPRFTVTDSVLSEEAVMGFEYGFSTTEPHCLTIWEGQFGDFCNGAQVIIDQFISSGEAKWGRLSGLTLFLPHGYEGQGPEHSSARLERFLQLCAEYNMQVCVPSTPAQMFHMLRRQMVRALRKPLIIMTPKSLLRHPLVGVAARGARGGGFRNVIDEVDDVDAARGDAARALQRQGVFRSVEGAPRSQGRHRGASCASNSSIRFPPTSTRPSSASMPNAREIVWCQEEPQNQGGWYQIRHRLQAKLGPKDELAVCGPRRRGSARDRHPRAARAAAEESGHRRAAGRAAGRDLTTNDAPTGEPN